MEIKDIKSLIKMVTETDITEFELETAGEKIRIERGKTPEHVSYAIPQAVSTPQMLAQTILTPSQEKPLPTPAVEAESDRSQTITSPIVGTMYRSPAPDAPPYVEIGQIVEKGQVLCIVEAMKLMNEIPSDLDGEVARIYVENGNPVEFGQKLFAIRPQKQG